MNTWKSLLSLGSVLVVIGAVNACSSDDDKPSGSGNNAGAGGEATEGGAASKGGSSAKGGSAGDAGSSEKGGADNGGAAGGGTNGGSTNTGTTAPRCNLSAEATADLPRGTIPESIDSNLTLTRDKVWNLSTISYVAAGATLTIEPCTRIEGSQKGTVVIRRGAKIVADGTKDEPIVFTSAKSVGSRAPGDWGGVILLGKAPNFKGTAVAIEGIEATESSQHGGTDPEDSSGTMRFVLLEFGGYELAAGNEINGLTFGSVGNKTVIENIMVNTTLDDCFEWFGGTVNAKNLVCNNGGDDMFDADQGYTGTLQNLFGRQIGASSSDPNGFEMDSDLGNKTPVTKVTVSNVTLCGTGVEGASITYGMVLRENVTGAFKNIVVGGFDFGVDLRDVGTNVTIQDSNLFSGVIADLDNPEDTTASGSPVDPSAGNEAAWFAGNGNSTSSPGFAIADCGATAGPAANVVSSKKGAFASDQQWMNGAWLNWATR